LCEPAASAVVLNVTPRAAEPITVVPSRYCTVPVGVPNPGVFTVTEARKLAVDPNATEEV
jgi:hypothetical protein